VQRYRRPVFAKGLEFSVCESAIKWASIFVGWDLLKAEERRLGRNRGINGIAFLQFDHYLSFCNQIFWKMLFGRGDLVLAGENAFGKVVIMVALGRKGHKGPKGLKGLAGLDGGGAM
jgi:hypothetical protein